MWTNRKLQGVQKPIFKLTHKKIAYLKTVYELKNPFGEKSS